MASSTECARSYAEPCRRCGGSGHEPGSYDGGALLAVLVVLIAYGFACVTLGWWLA